MVFAANYGGGSIAAYPMAADGTLKPASTFVQHKGSSVNPDRQKGPHAHGVTPDPSGTFLYVPDLGLDQVLVYRIDAAAGTIAPATPPFAAITPAGSGPRHIAISRDGKHAYVITEMFCTIGVFDRNATSGALSPVQTISTLPAGQAVEQGFSTAEVLLHPSGKFLYGSNRGHDSLVVYGVDASTGKLTLLQHVPTGGKTPRAFNIDPTGTFLVVGNQNSDTVGDLPDRSGQGHADGDRPHDLGRQAGQLRVRPLEPRPATTGRPSAPRSRRSRRAPSAPCRSATGSGTPSTSCTRRRSRTRWAHRAAG